MEPQLISGITSLAAGFAFIGLCQVVTGWLQLKLFLKRRTQPLTVYPAVTVLKPLHGDEPMLEAALASFCTQNYDALQIVFGLQTANDPALAVVNRLSARFSHIDIDVVISDVPHGENRKIANLINMLPLVKHNILLIADSDMHVPHDYVRRIIDTLERPNTGLVTSLYSGRAAFAGLAGQLGAAYINHSFTPGALIGRALGRRDCLGATMALRRQTLDAVGGLHALVDHLADDALLGRLIRKKGLRVRLGPTMPATTVAEQTLSELFAHELRWARTIRCVAPIGFILSAVQYPFIWLALTLVLSGGSAWSIGLTVTFWLLRYISGNDINRLLGLPDRMPAWLPPLRDLLSIAVMIASYTSNDVAWQGHTLTSRTRPALRQATTKLAPGKG